jgi:ArsR family transcriptional regulator, arsenate/arsenite/antimonite-responsive transcriptional repressor
MATTKNVSDLFGILSVESRLKMLLLLSRKRLCVGALSKELGITPGAVSQHLKLLKHAGFVTDCKCGNFVHYEINEKALEKALTNLNKFFLNDTALKGLNLSPCFKICNKGLQKEPKHKRRTS